MTMMRLPTRVDGPVTLLIQEPSAPHMFARSQLTLNRTSAEIVKWEPYAAASVGPQTAPMGARPSHLRGSRVYRSDCRQSGIVRRLPPGVDWNGNGMAALSLP